MSNDLQKAVFDTLTAALGAGIVFDQPPANKPGAYVVIGDHTATNWDTDDANGVEYYLTLYIYSTNTGQASTPTGYKTAKALARSVYSALHLTTLALPDAHALRAVYDSEQTRRDGDGISRQIVQRFRVLTHDI